MSGAPKPPLSLISPLGALISAVLGAVALAFAFVSAAFTPAEAHDQAECICPVCPTMPLSAEEQALVDDALSRVRANAVRP